MIVASRFFNAPQVLNCNIVYLVFPCCGIRVSTAHRCKLELIRTRPCQNCRRSSCPLWRSPAIRYAQEDEDCVCKSSYRGSAAFLTLLLRHGDTQNRLQLPLQLLHRPLISARRCARPPRPNIPVVASAPSLDSAFSAGEATP